MQRQQNENLHKCHCAPKTNWAKPRESKKGKKRETEGVTGEAHKVKG
jgi:hypothetical protein